MTLSKIIVTLELQVDAVFMSGFILFCIKINLKDKNEQQYADKKRTADDESVLQDKSGISKCYFTLPHG
jgi:hypothetical protein